MKLAKFVIYTLTILSTFVNLYEAKQFRYDIEPSYNPLPREWTSNAHTTPAARIHHGTKFNAAQRAMHVSNAYENTSSSFKDRIAVRHGVLKRALKKLN